MSQESKEELVQKLNQDISDYISNLKPKKYEDGWPEDKWEEEMEKHPFFMSKPVDEGGELPPLVEALQHLKYDPDMNTPEELAVSYKEDGNQYFKAKKYKWAVASYTEGLKMQFENPSLAAQLLSNRAASYFYLENFKDSLKDCTEAKKLNPGYLKPIIRGALCCMKMKQFDNCIAWCNEGIQYDENDADLQKMLSEAEKQKIIAARDERKAIAKAAKLAKEEDLIMKAIKSRRIRIHNENNFKLSDVQPLVPQVSESKVHLDENGLLVWPVLILYPEYGTSDYIQQFHEDSCMMDHLEEMFSEKNTPSWDVDSKYNPSQLMLYFSNDKEFIQVDPKEQLKFIMQHKKFELHDAKPCFFVMAKNSSFSEHWIKMNTIIK